MACRHEDGTFRFFKFFGDGMSRFAGGLSTPQWICVFAGPLAVGVLVDSLAALQRMALLGVLFAQGFAMTVLPNLISRIL